MAEVPLVDKTKKTTTVRCPVCHMLCVAGEKNGKLYKHPVWDSGAGRTIDCGGSGMTIGG
jgi:hypothetical protein